MKAITRNHQFENRLTLVEKGRKYFHLWHEKSRNPVKIKITTTGINAFQTENWDYFCQKEAEFFGGTYK